MAGYIGNKAVGLNVTTGNILGDVGVGGDLSLGDNDKAIFGAGSDLQIFHDGSNSYVQDSGTGDLIIRGSNNIRLQSNSGETYVIGELNGPVYIRHNDVNKLATTSTGIAVTGAISASSGNVTITDGNLVVAANHGIVFGVDGTGAGADTSELLDDYEEGTWTPAWTSTSASFSYNHAFGNYVKVGKIVHAQFYLLAQASNTTTNVVNLTGFPYPSADLSPFNQWAGNAWFQSTISVTPLMQRNASAVSIYKNTTGTPAVLVTSEIHNAYFVGSISYRAA